METTTIEQDFAQLQGLDHNVNCSQNGVASWKVSGIVLCVMYWDFT